MPYVVYSAENQHTPGHVESEHATMAEAMAVAQKGCDADGRLWWIKDPYGCKTTFTGHNVK